MPVTPAARPNILLLLPDQHRADWVGADVPGADARLPLQTPTLSALAARGVTFTRAYCSSPLCAPSRAALASGRSYARCGVADNGSDYPLDQPTFYQRLRAAGYRVAGVGKFDLHKDALSWHPDGSRLLDQWGFTDGIDNEGKIDGSRSYQAAGQPCGPYMAMLHARGLASPYLREHAERGTHHDAYTTALPDDAYCDNWLSDNGLRLLADLPADTPWFMQVNFVGPHNPMDVTATMRERWQDTPLPPPHRSDDPDLPSVLRARQNYAAMIENIDRQCGRFLELVAARGESARTLVVYGSDHGEMLGDHGRWGKSTWREPAVRVPLVIAGPGVKAAGADAGHGARASTAPVSLHDLAATFLTAAGAQPLPAPDAGDAQPLQPLLAGEAAHRDAAVSALGTWRLAADARYKLVLDGDRPPQLYDHQHDPHEDDDLAASLPAALEPVVARLGQALA